MYGTPEIGEGRADTHSDFLGLLPALSLPPVHSFGTHGFSPSKQAGPRPAGSRGLVSIGDRRPNAASTHLRLHVQLRATRARGAQWKRTRRRGSRDPRSLAGPRHKARALRAPVATTSVPHPPLLNSNRRHPSHLPPHARTNRRRRHSRGPIAEPSASRGHTPPGLHLLLPASPASGRQAG